MNLRKNGTGKKGRGKTAGKNGRWKKNLKEKIADGKKAKGKNNNMKINFLTMLPFGLFFDGHLSWYRGVVGKGGGDKVVQIS